MRAVGQPKRLPLCRTASVVDVSAPLPPGTSPSKVWLQPSLIERWRGPVSGPLEEVGQPLFILTPHWLGGVGVGGKQVFCGWVARPDRTNSLKSQGAKVDQTIEEWRHSLSHRNLRGRISHKF